MKKIVCELCEGTEFIKENGMFVCQGCGTRYSVEEARSMMREVDGGAPAAAPSAPVNAVPAGNPNQQQVDNLLILATNAYSAGNNEETENYCNRAIELDATCYKAWFLKGKAIGWSSKLDNNRMEEAAHSFCQGIDFAPEEEKEDLKNQAVEELKKLGLACISLRKDNFAKDPTTSNLNGFKNDRIVLLNALKVLLAHGNVVGIPEGYEDRIATMMNESAVAALNMVRKAWDGVDHPSDKDLTTYIDWISNIESLIRQSIDASDDDDDADIVRYKNLAIVLEEPIGKHSDKRYWDSFWNEYRWTASRSLTDEAVASRRRSAQQARDKAAELERKAAERKAAEARKAAEEKQARIRAYWEAHAEEKAALDAELKELEDKKEKLSVEIAEIDPQIKELEDIGKVPSEEEDEKIAEQIKELVTRRDKLGLFAGKEKKQIGEEIASLNGRRDSLKGKIAEEKNARKAEADVKLAPLKAKLEELQSQIETINKRISAIDTELTKDPEA